MHLATSDQERLDLGFYGCTCNWGSHFCALYETERERDEIVFGFLRQGQIARDLAVYVPAQRTFEDFRDKYGTFVGHDCHAPFEHITLSTAQEFYYPSGHFSPWEMDDVLDAFFEQSQKEGPRNVRGTAEMAWALQAIPGAEHLMAYESRLNYFIAGKPWISVCLYDLRMFSGADIMRVLQVHPYVVASGTVTENPYFENPDDWLARNAPQYLSRAPQLPS